MARYIDAEKMVKIIDGVHAMGYREGYKQAENEWNKKIDEIIAEIEETYINNCDFNYQIAIDIINKYCNKENK